MARPCTICPLADRDAIDLALAGGEPVTRVAAKFSVSPDAISRHFAKHVRPGVARVQAAVRDQTVHEARRILDVEQQIAAANNVVLRTMSDAHHRGDGRLAMQAADRVLRQCEFVHTLEVDARAGELEQRVQALEAALAERLDVSHNGVDHRVSVA